MSCTLNGRQYLHLTYESWHLYLQSKDLEEAKSELGIHWAVTAITRPPFTAWRIISTIFKETKQTSESIATLTIFSPEMWIIKNPSQI